MPGEGVVIPLWGKLVMLSLAKKGLILTAGYLYGFPRLYRRSQKLVRYITRERSMRRSLQGYVRTGFRLPAKLLHLQPRKPTTPALQYLSLLPRRLLPPKEKPVRNPSNEASKPVQAYRRLRTSFASSALVQRHSANWTAGRGKLMSLRERFAGSGLLQAVVVSRAEHAALLWKRAKQQPYSLVPAI